MPKALQLVGQKFNRLLVIAEGEPSFYRSGKTKECVQVRRWKCQCDCGKIITALAGPMKRGRTKSCGCWTKERLRQKNRLPFGQAAKNIVYNIYRTNAKKRGLAWNFTPERFVEVASQNCHYCGAIPSNVFRPRRDDGSEKLNGDFVYNGIDRMDNAVGYIEGNCVACCSRCNMAKRAMSYSEFKKWITQLIRHNLTLGAGS
jgi:hypothetical protein